MPDKNEFKLDADDEGFQIGQMTGGTVQMPRFVARLGPWGFGGIAVFAVAAVVIVALLVSRSGDSAASSTGTSSPGGVTSNASADSGCAPSESTVWLEEPDKVYGPFTQRGIDYFVRWDTYAVWVRTGTESVETVNDFPETLGRLDQWLPLFGHEALSVCQDGSGNLYADFR
jgi:hypothetical protein